MNINEQVNLKEHSTMRLGGVADFACDVKSREELVEAIRWAVAHELPYRVIGSGSNIIWSDDGFRGLLILNQIKQFSITPTDNETAEVIVGSGMNWDAFVAQTVDAGLSGVEAMSSIPGTCGATPIQNVGAYGQDISQTLVSVEAYDTSASQYVTILKSDCDFGYRTSRFNRVDRGRFLIVSLTFQLTKMAPIPPFYPPVTEYLETNKLETTAANIRIAVVAIRASKLPDPAQIGNSGSFFANPVISPELFETLHNQYDDIRFWEASDGVKISGAWLIEKSGFKDFHDGETGMATWTNQPLVIVNENALDTASLLKFKQKIVDAVQTKFGVTLQQEPELLP
jgi:UDP-N-acetylmuramate dehydrogenase